MSGTLLGYLALAVFGAAAAFWYHRLKAVRTGEVRGLVMGIMTLAALMGAVAFLAGTSSFGGIAAGIALLGGGVFLALQPLSHQERHASAVRVGGPILDFTAPDAEGAPFDLATLHGRPFLLKFFRGHW